MGSQHDQGLGAGWSIDVKCEMTTASRNQRTVNGYMLLRLLVEHVLRWTKTDKLMRDRSKFVG